MKKNFKKAFACLMAVASLAACMVGGVSVNADTVEDGAIVVPRTVYNPTPLEQSYSKFYRSVTEANNNYTASDHIFIKNGKGTRYVVVGVYSYDSTGTRLENYDWWEDTVSQNNNSGYASTATSLGKQVKFRADVYSGTAPKGTPTDVYSEIKIIAPRM